jgi:hypothetical protein
MYVSAFGVEDTRIISKADRRSGSDTAAGAGAGAAGGGALASRQLLGLADGRTKKGGPKAIGDGRHLPAARGYANAADKAKKLRRIAGAKIGGGLLAGAAAGGGVAAYNRSKKN